MRILIKKLKDFRDFYLTTLKWKKYSFGKNFHAEALEKLYNDEEYRQQLCNGAIQRAAEFSWGNKIEQLNAIYQNLIDSQHKS